MNINGLELLTFSIGGVKMAVDTAQVSEMLKIEHAADKGINICRIPEKIHFCVQLIGYSDPHVVVIKDVGEPYGVLIDLPEDIVRVSIDDIHTLPQALALSSTSKAIWGALPKDDNVILLLDLYKLWEDK